MPLNQPETPARPIEAHERQRPTLAPRVSRRALLAGGLGLVAADSLLLEPRWLEVNPQDLFVSALPSGLEGLRIAHVTDVHLAGLHAAARAVMDAVETERPEVVVLTGDLIERPEELATLSAFLTQVRGTIATAAVLGNWERWGKVPRPALRQVLERAGAALLVNDSLRVSVAGGSLELVGLDDPVAGEPDPAVALRRTRGGPLLWLVHAPAWIDSAPADLEGIAVLAGHTHGGQARLGPIAPFTPTGSGSYRSGWYSHGFAPMYVSRGVGTSVVPARLFCRPELPIFSLRRA